MPSRPPQPMLPSGLVGRLFGWTMDMANRRAMDAALDHAAPPVGAALLEIGFGTGLFARRLLSRRETTFVAGVDPSPLMVETAQRRNAGDIAAGRADLRCGTATHLPWPDASFDGAFALHSFQFWADPAGDLAEVRRTLKAGGLLVIVLRAHGQNPPGWLPNPISRSGAEIRGTIDALSAAGFANVRHAGDAGSSAIVLGARSG